MASSLALLAMTMKLRHAKTLCMAQIANRKLRVIIIGAGIGGLAAAIALRQRGLEAKSLSDPPSWRKPAPVCKSVRTV
jgi:heterodisulfide reductase subunit A-like polyferredoxin